MPTGVYPGQIYPGQTWPDGAFPSAVLPEGPILEAAFGSAPDNINPAWINLTPRLIEFQVKRGRQSELDRIDTGTMTVRINNSDRALDPTNTLSPYYPLVLPMRQIRLRWTLNGTTYNLFQGFANSWPQAWDGPNFGYSTVQASDAMRVLALVDVGTGAAWPRELSGARINRILDAAGWPVDRRTIDPGKSEIAATVVALGSGVTALSAIQDAADAELGIFFIDGAGNAIYHDRHHRRQASYFTPKAIFGDINTAGLPYQDVALDTDADRIWNDVQISAGDGAQRATDTTSIQTFLRRTLTRSVPLARGDQEAADQAMWLVSQFKDPRYRLDAIRVNGTNDTLRTHILGRDFSDHVRVNRWPQKVGSVITQESAIESVDIRWSIHWDQNVEATWLLSSNAFSAVGWGILDDATFGLVDTTAIAIY